MPFHRAIPDDKQRGKAGSGPGGGLGAYVQAEKLMQIALVLPCAVLIGWGGGAWLDMRLHQSWITLVGIALGSIAGMVSAIRLALAAVGDPKAGNNSGNDTTGGNSREDS